jgi:hypothetical protein
MNRIFLRFLVAEVIVLSAAITSFSVISQKMVAGFIAGMFFVSLGVWIVAVGFRNKPFRRSGTFIVGCLYFFAVALPLMITRFMNTALSFEEVRILGLPGPVFHQISTAIYLGLMLATVWDLVFAIKEKRRHDVARADAKRPGP